MIDALKSRLCLDRISRLISFFFVSFFLSIARHGAQLHDVSLQTVRVPVHIFCSSELKFRIFLFSKRENISKDLRYPKNIKNWISIFSKFQTYHLPPSPLKYGIVSAFECHLYATTFLCEDIDERRIVRRRLKPDNNVARYSLSRARCVGSERWAIRSMNILQCSTRVAGGHRYRTVRSIQKVKISNVHTSAKIDIWT